MVFSDTSTNLGIIQDITFKTGVSTDNFPIADRTRSINNWYMKTTGWIIMADGRWQWDDSNQTDQPVATTDIVTDQRSYTVVKNLPSANQDWLVVTKVQIKDSDGNWIELKPIDNRQINEERFTESGTPEYYDFEGTEIKLYTSPNYDSTAGLQVWFQRAPLLFAADDTTKKPGFASIFHEILSLGAKYDWEVAKETGNPEQTMRDIMNMKKNIEDHYGRRNNYEVNRIRRPYRRYK